MRVLLAIDGSKFSENAIQTCLKYAKMAASVRLISVVEPIYGIGTEPFNVSAEFYAEAEKNAREQASGVLQDAVNKCRENFTQEVEVSSAILHGVPGQKIVEEAEEWKADLIIVGSHGYGFWQRALIGSVSDAVVHHAPCSVLVVKGLEKA
jgi:nucleotide-binding universal stress UspA family protein